MHKCHSSHLLFLEGCHGKFQKAMKHAKIGWEYALLKLVQSQLLRGTPFHKILVSDVLNDLVDMSLLRTGTRLKNAYELLNLRALKFSPVNKIYIFQCMGKIFGVEFQRYLSNSTQNIIPIHWKIWFLYNIEIWRALRFRSSYVFLKCTPTPPPPPRASLT